MNKVLRFQKRFLKKSFLFAIVDKPSTAQSGRIFTLDENHQISFPGLKIEQIDRIVIFDQAVNVFLAYVNVVDDGQFGTPGSGLRSDCLGFDQMLDIFDQLLFVQNGGGQSRSADRLGKDAGRNEKKIFNQLFGDQIVFDGKRFDDVFMVYDFRSFERRQGQQEQHLLYGSTNESFEDCDQSQ